MYVEIHEKAKTGCRRATLCRVKRLNNHCLHCFPSTVSSLIIYLGFYYWLLLIQSASATLFQNFCIHAGCQYVKPTSSHHKSSNRKLWCHEFKSKWQFSSQFIMVFSKFLSLICYCRLKIHIQPNSLVDLIPS